MIKYIIQLYYKIILVGTSNFIPRLREPPARDKYKNSYQAAFQAACFIKHSIFTLVQAKHKVTILVQPEIIQIWIIHWILKLSL